MDGLPASLSGTYVLFPVNTTNLSTWLLVHSNRGLLQENKADQRGEAVTQRRMQCALISSPRSLGNGFSLPTNCFKTMKTLPLVITKSSYAT